MHHNHRNLIIPTYDTEVLEKALEKACNGNIQIRHRLEIRNLAISLWYDVELKKQGITNQSHVEPIKALTNFKANLQRRKKTSDILTSSRLIEIPEPANTILHVDIAYKFRDEIDDYTQIDFGNDKHVELLKAAVDSSISKVANKQGRPVNEALDEFFIGLKDLYEAATGKTAIAEGHHMTKRAVIYARYSSDLQRDASIEDQVRVCKNLIDQNQWTFVQTYSDHGISGASHLRPGYQQLLSDARSGNFQVVVSESIDRISRDQEHIAAFHKAMSFAGIDVITASEGAINELHIGLKGTMSALYLKDLADKTRRGLEGRVRKGKSGGGICYGYSVVHKTAPDGSIARGDRAINESEAVIIRRIFNEYKSGRSPKSIAHSLNHEGIPGPKGGRWSPSTIYGNWRRGTGILNNEIYIGKLVWNRQHFIKDPVSGKRQARPNPPEKWVTEEVPSLRIVDEDLWQQVKSKQTQTRRTISNSGNRRETVRRPRYLLSGLLKCGACRGGFSKVSKHHYGCSTARNKATCDNMLVIRRDVLEQTVLDGLKNQLMQPEAYKAFVDEFTKEYNIRASQEEITRKNLNLELEKIQTEQKKLIEAIKAGIPGEMVKDEMLALKERRSAITEKLKATPAPTPRLHPNLSLIYKNKVANLIDALNNDDTISEANEAIRQLIETIRLVPFNGRLKIELFGELAALLNLGMAPKNEHPLDNSKGVQVTVVAGAGFVQAPTIITNI